MGKLRSFLSILSLLVSSQIAHAAVVCNPTAVNPIIHAEGVAERLGDILLDCSGATPGQRIAGNLTIFVTTNITNKLSPQNFADVVLTVDVGNGPVSAAVPAIVTGVNQVSFNGVDITAPASGRFSLRISNLRVNAAQIASSGFNQGTVVASLSFSGSSILFNGSQVTVGTAQRSLLASILNAVVSQQQGSPLPDTITFSNLIATGTRVSSSRVTEDAFNAFQPRQLLSDNGVRLIAAYSNVPAGARLFTPDVIAGSNTVKPTAAGDFGGAVSGGQYLPGSGTLLLVKVRNTDANGAGGSLVYTPPPAGAGVQAFDGVSEVNVSNGTGMVVYEVVDADLSARETAQIPTWIGLTPSGDAKLYQINQQITLGPVSTTVTASSSAPVPRFVATVPASDCSLLGDCSGAFLPRLFVDPDPLTFTVTAGGGFQIRYARILNNGGNVLVWNATVTYKNGSDWVRVFPQSGIGEGRIRIDVLPQTLAPGTYDATLTIDAGQQAGVVNLPIHVQVNAGTPGPPAASTPIVTSVVNAASFAPVALVRGSLGTLKGANLAGTNVGVTFNGTPAAILYKAADQINFQVPANLPAGNTAQLVVTVDGSQSAAFTVNLASVSPAIFNPGILNQDNTVNGPANPALVGSIVQIFTTGLLPPEGGTVDVKIHDRGNLTPLYAGDAPGIPGLQQVNVRVPADLPTMTTEVVVCGTASSGQRACSPAGKITLRQ